MCQRKWHIFSKSFPNVAIQHTIYLIEISAHKKVWGDKRSSDYLLKDIVLS